MLTRIGLGLALLVAVPLWSQVEPSASGGPPSSSDQMNTPPPVSGATYPTATGAESRSNQLRGGVSFQLGYDDNVLGGDSSAPVGDFSYTIKPNLALDQVNARRHTIFTYSPGFTLYQKSTARNEADQSASGTFEYRLSPHSSMRLTDSFDKSTNVFNQPAAGVSGSSQVPTVAVVAPFADQIGNSANGEVSLQFSRNGMIGAGGTSSLVHYLDPTQASGISNSNSQGGSGFYNLRLSSTQYAGVNYQYTRMGANGTSGTSLTIVETIDFYYTLYLAHSFSFSVSGGPQRFDVSQSFLPDTAAWTPTFNASLGWQARRSSLAGSYSRTVSGAGGLLGAFRTNSASASGRLQWSHHWTASATVSYATESDVGPSSASTSSGGRTISGTVSAQRSIGEHLGAEAGYARLNQSYAGVAAISQSPNSDREYISISYQFSRPLGR